MRPGTSNHWWNAQQFDRDRSAFQCSATLIARLGAEPWRPAAPEPDSRVSSIKGLTVIEPNLDRVWAALMTAARPGRTPFTVLQLATSGLDGAPKVRSVILRGADAERGTVSFFTDLRSSKIEEIRHEPRVSLVAYDEDAGFQIRLE